MLYAKSYQRNSVMFFQISTILVELPASIRELQNVLIRDCSVILDSELFSGTLHSERELMLEGTHAVFLSSKVKPSGHCILEAR